MLLSFTLTANANAADYYVDTSGSDSDSGSYSSPFRTLQHAADIVAPGDTVHVRNGTYDGFRLSTSGTAHNRIVFQTVGDGVVINTVASGGDAIYLSSVDYATIDGFRIEDVNGGGIQHHDASATNPVYGLILRNNSILRSEDVGIYLSQVMDSLIENNEVADSGWGGTHCMYMANAGTGNTTIRGNRLHGCVKGGIHFNGDSSIGGDGIISGMIIENNIIYDNTTNGLNLDGVQDSIIQNNLIYNNSPNGIRAFQIDGEEGPKNLIIVNNTIKQDYGWAVRLTAEEGGNTVFNNILLVENGSAGSIAITDDDSSDFHSDYNIVIDTFTPDRDATYLDLSQWQESGYDPHSLLGNPGDLFVDYSNGDYHLKAGSPAIGAGVASFNGHQAPATDLEGNGRNSLSIGAYEYNSGPVDGDCGADDGQTVSIPPAHLCDAGTPSTVTGPDPDAEWTWTCAGINGGNSDYCSAMYTPPPTCAESDWNSVDGTCQQDWLLTRTWTKTGSCAGGVTHPDTEQIHCTYTPVDRIIDVRVTASSDDAEEWVADGSMISLSSSDLELLLDSGNIQSVGIRFPDLDIPRGATITNAYLEFTSYEAYSDDIDLTINSHSVDNSSAFASNNYNISSRSKSNASVNWNNIETWGSNTAYQSPDISALLQEITDRTGWSQNNAISFILTGANGNRRAYSYDGNPNRATLLHVEFSTGSATLRADVNQDGSINTVDAQLTLRYSYGLDMSATAWQPSTTTGDVNCDGNTDSADAHLILRYSLGLSMDSSGWLCP